MRGWTLSCAGAVNSACIPLFTPATSAPMIAAVVAAASAPGATRTTTTVVSACPAMARSAAWSVPVAPAFAIAS